MPRGPKREYRLICLSFAHSPATTTDTWPWTEHLAQCSHFTAILRKRQSRLHAHGAMNRVAAGEKNRSRALSPALMSCLGHYWRYVAWRQRLIVRLRL